MAQPGGGEIESRLPVRERADDAGAPPDLAHDTLEHRYPPNFRGGGVLGRRQASTCRPHRYDADRAGGFGKSLLASDEVVIEATANSVVVSRVWRRSWRG
jgi:hypothetical protein